MSKCQRTKYLAGGKAAAGGSCVRENSSSDTQGVSSAFAALAAARDAQIAGLWSKEETKSPLTPVQNQTQIVLHKVQSQQPIKSRTADIDCILNGDYE